VVFDLICLFLFASRAQCFGRRWSFPREQLALVFSVRSYSGFHRRPDSISSAGVFLLLLGSVRLLGECLVSAADFRFPFRDLLLPALGSVLSFDFLAAGFSCRPVSFSAS
jgi:hypothetical protein